MRYKFEDIGDISKRLGIDLQVTGSDATQIFLHQLAAKPPKTNYASADHTRYFSLWQLRRTLNWAAATLLFGNLVWAGANIWQGDRNAKEALTQEIQTQRVQGDIEKITRGFPGASVPASDMKAAVSVMHQLEKSALFPADILLPLSKALDQHPWIELDELAWRTDATEPVAANTLADVPARIITLKGTLTGFAGDYRAALKHLDDFQRDLTAQGYQVTILSKPLDVSPAGSITDLRENRTDTLAFSLKLSRRPPA